MLRFKGRFIEARIVQLFSNLPSGQNEDKQKNNFIYNLLQLTIDIKATIPGTLCTTCLTKTCVQSYPKSSVEEEEENLHESKSCHGLKSFPHLELF